MLPRRRAPFWFELTVAVALALGVRALEAWLQPAGRGAGDDPPVYLAFWQIIATIASTIWKGLEVAGRVTLEVLKWSVLQLWQFARVAYDAVREVGKGLVLAARRSWDFFQSTYEHVLKPAWQHFWKWFERSKQWLEDIFRPVFKWLNFARKHLLNFYTKYVRPILDVLGIAQKVLGVLERIGFEWAGKLDQQLAELQRRIDLPFRFALAKINEVVNLLNRIVTLDGLIQRVALVRSIERDIREVRRAFVNWGSSPLTAEEWRDLKRRGAPRSDAEITRDFSDLVGRGSGPRAALAEELAETWRARLAA